MSIYSFVLIFAFILAFHVSTGNAIECYKCKHDTGSPDPNCVNVNEKTTKEFTDDRFPGNKLAGPKCLYTRKPEKDGAYAIERKLIIFTSWHESKRHCIHFLEENLGADCKICDTNLCNSMSGSLAVSPQTTSSPPSVSSSSPSNTSLPEIEPIDIDINRIGYFCYPRRISPPSVSSSSPSNTSLPEMKPMRMAYEGNDYFCYPRLIFLYAYANYEKP
ncbi:uncharacterized protein LOC135844697 [Planococcus citri]|uniref:uncharacterized protein LOC135844697 n=1 Tax=Planococcus citri TaxID=170843 RepID=UPI0031F74D55